MTAEKLKAANEANRRLLQAIDLEESIARQGSDVEVIRLVPYSFSKFRAGELLEIANCIRAIARRNRALAHQEFSNL